ncbi:MAG TPA: DUF2934 domain-containing protein [Blastocatellia bacterium]|nr:DUF2934 domain-containing protein [Blastocatellia bacterium]
MTKESLEKLRERLLGDENVQQMIRARAYEIYELRGGQPGREAQDWLRAEREVLAFLVARESGRAEDKEPRPSTASTASASPDTTATPKRRKSRVASEPRKGSTTRAASKRTPTSRAKAKRNRKTPGVEESK